MKISFMEYKVSPVFCINSKIREKCSGMMLWGTVNCLREPLLFGYCKTRNYHMTDRLWLLWIKLVDFPFSVPSGKVVTSQILLPIPWGCSHTWIFFHIQGKTHDFARWIYSHTSPPSHHFYLLYHENSLKKQWFGVECWLEREGHTATTEFFFSPQKS